MYRVLIVDDEEFIVDYLSELLRTQQQWELDVYCGYSASEALEWLRRTKIDIMITDIQMPVMNGVALAQQVRENWPQCKVIFLTAHADFDYVYRAIKSNVVDYILKTEGDEYILSVVGKAIQVLEEELQNIALAEQVKNQAEDAMAVGRKKILVDILKERYPVSENVLRQLSSDMRPEAPVLIFAGLLKENDTDILAHYQRIHGVRMAVEHFLGERYCCEYADYSYHRIVWLIQERNAGDLGGDGAFDLNRNIVFVAGMLENVQQLCQDTLSIQISFVLQNTELSFAQLPPRFQLLDQELSIHAEDEVAFVITYGAFAKEEGQTQIYPKESRLPNIASKLRHILEASQREEFNREYEQVLSQLEQYTSWHSNAAKELYYSIAVALISVINQRGLVEKVSCRIGLYRLFMPTEMASWKAAGEYLKEVAMAIFEEQRQNGEIANNIVSYLIDYMDEHIAEEISLVRLSEVSGYNASYLSRVFSATKGETIYHYISRKRIELIKTLMQNERLNIGDIASRAGFEYRTYFNRFVKKMTGLSPLELRKQVLQGKDHL